MASRKNNGNGNGNGGKKKVGFATHIIAGGSAGAMEAVRQHYSYAAIDRSSPRIE
jgi:hypothetical protein